MKKVDLGKDAAFKEFTSINYKTVVNNIRNNVIKLRKIKKLSQVNFAKAAGMSIKHYKDIEYAEVYPEFWDVLKMCVALDVGFFELTKDYKKK